jgi:hypothetical protein
MKYPNLFCKSDLYGELQMPIKDGNDTHRNRRMEDTSYASVSGQPEISVNTWGHLYKTRLNAYEFHCSVQASSLQTSRGLVLMRGWS